MTAVSGPFPGRLLPDPPPVVATGLTPEQEIRARALTAAASLFILDALDDEGAGLVPVLTAAIAFADWISNGKGGEPS